MAERTLTPTVSPAELGLRCPACGHTEALSCWEQVESATKVIRLTCARCALFLRHLVPAEGEFLFEQRRPDAHRAELSPPGKDWLWIGHIRQADGFWRAVALTATLGKCWDALLTYPGEGDRLCIPTRPRKGKGKAEEDT